MNDDQRDAMLIAIRNELAENTRKTDALGAAFPGGDMEGHRRYHEAMIKALEQRNKIVQSCLEKAAQAGMLAGFGWLGLAAWNYFKLGLPHS